MITSRSAFRAFWVASPSLAGWLFSIHLSLRVQVRSVVDLFYGYLKKGCCDGLCEARLKALTTLHLRGMHFKVGTAGAPCPLNCGGQLLN